MDITIKAPYVPKAKVLLWTDVTYHDMEEIEKLNSSADLESLLSSIFKFDPDEPKKGVMLELYVQTVLFCKERNFKKEQISALLSIVKSIHEANTETPLDNVEQCLKYCSDLLLCHTVRRPPFSINIYNSQEAACVLQYIHNNYMKHYKLYKYIFTPQVKLDLRFSYTAIPEIVDVPATEEEDAEDDSTKTQTEEEELTLGQKTSDLKAMIEKEVKDQMKVVSAHLDEKFKKIADHHSRSEHSSHKSKK